MALQRSPKPLFQVRILVPVQEVFMKFFDKNNFFWRENKMLNLIISKIKENLHINVNWDNPVYCYILMCLFFCLLLFVFLISHHV